MRPDDADRAEAEPKRKASAAASTTIGARLTAASVRRTPNEALIDGRQQLDPVAPGIGGVEAAESRQRVVPLHRRARFDEPRCERVERGGVETERGMRFPRRRERILDADVQLPVAEREPRPAALPQRLGLLELGQAEQLAEEAPRLALAAAGSRDLDVVELDQPGSAAGSGFCSGASALSGAAPFAEDGLRRRRERFGFVSPSAAPFFLRRRRRRLRLDCCFGAGRFSDSAWATSWIVPSRSRASSSSFVA